MSTEKRCVWLLGVPGDYRYVTGFPASMGRLYNNRSLTGYAHNVLVGPDWYPFPGHCKAKRLVPGEEVECEYLIGQDHADHLGTVDGAWFTWESDRKSDYAKWVETADALARLTPDSVRGKQLTQGTQ
ncbi:MAG: hypothetical protein ACREXJ_00235 [Gammaproteobacteria bacterium]